MDRLDRRHVLALLLAGAGAFGAWTAPAAAQPTPLAIKGYDPVAYFTLGQPVPGVAQFEHDWDEHRYRFASAEHRDLFKADPARYAPQFANLCAMALTRGEFVEANPEYWLISDGRLYLFGDRAGPQRFDTNPERHREQALKHQPRSR